MAIIFKNDNIEFKEDPNRIDNFRLFSASPRLFTVAKSKNLMFDLRLLNPGQYSCPYHFHSNAEELMMVISGSMTLRLPDGTCSFIEVKGLINEEWMIETEADCVM
jgi:uncharacterized protein YaiE (UPF0345 family)